MADSKPAEQKPAAQSSTPSRQSESDRPQPRQGNSGQSSEPGEGMVAALETQRKARTEVPGYPDVDARLDNRTGVQRPPLEQWPAKPQQIDGPDLAHQLEHTRATLKNVQDDDVDRKGMRSPGPHGLSDESLAETDKPLFGPEGLAEAGPGSKA